MTTITNPMKLLIRPPSRRWPHESASLHDLRAEKGGPPEVGQVATLAFRTGQPRWPFEYVAVRVAEAARDQFQGEVLHDIIPELTDSEKIRRGVTLVFTAKHIFQLTDKYEPAA